MLGCCSVLAVTPEDHGIEGRRFNDGKASPAGESLKRMWRPVQHSTLHAVVLVPCRAASCIYTSMLVTLPSGLGA